MKKKDSRIIRIAITRLPGLYTRMAPLWRKVNKGLLARIQFFFLFKKYDKQKKMMEGKEDLLWSAIEIETINRCNGTCPFCPVNRNVDPRKPVFMKDELFYKIINELGELHYDGILSLFSNNEPYLDERIIGFMKYAKEKVPLAHLNVYTNGKLLTMDKYLGSIRYLDELYIDNYDDHGILSDNVRRIKEYCDRHPEAYDKTIIAYRRLNEVLTTRGGSSPNKKTEKKQTLPCILPFRQMVIRPDGKLSLCCNDALGKVTMGDANEDSLINIWNSRKYKKVRSILRKDRSRLKICRYCDTVTTTK